MTGNGRGRHFYKMSGSGNDFVVVDARTEPAGALADPAAVQRICARGTGVGADGIVFLEPSDRAAVRLTYLNSDGSPAELCGNATLCTTRLAVDLAMADPAGFQIDSGAGLIGARMASDGRPEIDLAPVTVVRPMVEEVTLGAGERRVGYAIAGVPHLVILCDDVSVADVVGRGRPLRYLETLPGGANVNFVSRQNGVATPWRIRTYERGVEGETLACGTGAVATAVLLAEWGEAPADAVDLETRSGQVLRVRLQRADHGWRPSLSGEGRIVFEGTLVEL